MSLEISKCPGKRARLTAEDSARRPGSPPQRGHRGLGAPHADARRVQPGAGSPAQPPPSLAPGARGRAAARPLTSAAGAPDRGPLAGSARPGATPPGTAFPPETAGGGARRWVGPGPRGAGRIPSIRSPSGPALVTALCCQCLCLLRSIGGIAPESPLPAAEPCAPRAPSKYIYL